MNGFPVHRAWSPIYRRRKDSTSHVKQIQHVRLSDKNRYYFISYFFFFLTPSMDRAYPTREFFILVNNSCLSVYFIPVNSFLSPFPKLLTHPPHAFFTLPVDFLHATGNRSDLDRVLIHGWGLSPRRVKHMRLLTLNNTCGV